MLNNKIKIKDIFNTFMAASKVLEISYKQYDNFIKQDIIYDFRNEFFAELEIYLEDRDDFTDLIEEYEWYEANQRK